MGWNNSNVFQVLIISGGAGSGIFVYSPSPGLGNLIGSWAGSAGVDAFGNAYPAGFSATQGTFSGELIAGIISNTPIGSSSITGSDFSQGTIESTLITLDASGGQVLAYGSVTVVTTFNSNGTFTPPAGVTSISRLQLWGGGGGGQPGDGGGGNGGGGGGEYAERSNEAVTPLTGYPVTVGAAGGSGANGGNSAFSGDATTTTAHGGKAGGSRGGGVAGSGSGAPIHFNGGAGGNGLFNGGGGGGGSSAGTSSSGGAGHNGTLGSGGAGGTPPAGGGSGGAGGLGSAGSAGSLPGGAGGGGSGVSSPGGAGTHGRVIITYQTGATNLIAAMAGVAGTDAAGNAFGAGLTIAAGDLNAFHPGSSPTTVETAQPFSFNGANGWLASGRQTCQYYLKPDGTVRIMGSVKVPVGFATGQAITNAAAAGYRPANTTSITGHDVTAAPNGPVRLVWTSGGVLQYSSAEGTAVAAADSIDIVPVDIDINN